MVRRGTSCRESVGNAITSRWWGKEDLSRRSKSGAEEVPHRGKRQEGGAREPDPKRRLGRILLCPDPALVDRRRDAAENDSRGRDHQRGEHQRQPHAAEQERRGENLRVNEREQQPGLVEETIDDPEEGDADEVERAIHDVAQLALGTAPRSRKR
jgi:hypothetical protein